MPLHACFPAWLHCRFRLVQFPGLVCIILVMSTTEGNYRWPAAFGLRLLGHRALAYDFRPFALLFGSELPVSTLLSVVIDAHDEHLPTLDLVFRIYGLIMFVDRLARRLQISFDGKSGSRPALYQLRVVPRHLANPRTSFTILPL